MREYLDAAVFKDMILCADAALAENTQQINELNVFPVHLESIRCVPAQKPDAKVAFGSIDYIAAI